MTAPANIVYAGQGPIYIGDYDDTNGTAAQGFLKNVKKIACGNRTLQISQTREKGKIPESCSGQSLTLKTWTKSLSAMCKLSMAQFSRNDLAIALYGTGTSVAGSTVTGETMPTVAVGDYVFTKYPGVSSVVVKDSAGTPATLVADTNYKVDSAAHGRLQILDLGAFTQPLATDYAYASHGRVTAFTGAATRKGLIMSAVNIAESNAPVRLFVPLIDFDPTKGFDWLGSDESVLDLEGEILYCSALADDGAWGPYFKADAASFADV